MKISHRWLLEFVETDLPPAALADRLVNAGIEVPSLWPLVEGLGAWSSARSPRSSANWASRPPATSIASAGSCCAARILGGLRRAQCRARAAHRVGVAGRDAAGERAFPVDAPSRLRRSAARSPRGCSAPRRSWASARTTPASSCCPPTRRSARTSRPVPRPRRHHPRDRDHAEPARRAHRRRRGARGRGAHRARPSASRSAVKEGECRGATLADRRDPRPRPLPALRGARHHRPHGRALAAVARPAAPRGRPAPDQQRRRRDELRHVGDGPAAPRLRLRHASPRHAIVVRRGPAGRADHDARRAGARARRRTCYDLRRRAAGRDRRRHGRRQTPRSTATTTTVLLESAYFNPGVDPPDVARARAAHRRRVSLRARRRHRGRSARRWTAPRSSWPISAAARSPRGSSTCTRRRARARASRSGRSRVERVIGACPPARRSCAFSRRWASPWTTRARAPGRGAELPARHRPGGRPRRGDHPRLGLRQDPLDAGERRPAAARDAPGRSHARGRRDGRADRGGPLPGRHVCLRRSRTARGHGLERAPA